MAAARRSDIDTPVRLQCYIMERYLLLNQPCEAIARDLGLPAGLVDYIVGCYFDRGGIHVASGINEVINTEAVEL